MNKYAHTYFSEVTTKLAGVAEILSKAIPAITSGGFKAFDSVGRAIGENPGLEQKLRGISQYSLVDKTNQLKNTIGGAVGMGTLGAGISGVANTPSILSSDEDTMSKAKSISQSIGSGFAEGAVPGALAGRFLPKVIQRGIGRAMTNSIVPISYEAEEHAKNVAGSKPMDYLRAFLKDQPMDHVVNSPESGAWNFGSAGYGDKDSIYRMGARHQMYRDMFDLPAREQSLGALNLSRVEPSGSKVYGFNPNDPRGRYAINEVKENLQEGFGTAHGTRDYVGNKAVAGNPLFATQSTMGGYHIAPDGTYRDEWDIGLGDGNKIDSGTNLLRGIANMFTQPSAIEGKTISQGEALSKYKGELGSLDDSFYKNPSDGTDIRDLIAKSNNTDRTNVNNYISNIDMTGNAGRKAKIRAQLVSMLGKKDFDPKGINLGKRIYTSPEDDLLEDPSETQEIDDWADK